MSLKHSFKSESLLLIRRCILTRSGIWAWVFILAIKGIAYGDGYRIPYQGTAAASQAEAFTAEANDASALHYNPAGMTQLSGVQFYMGTNFITGQTEFTSPTGEIATADLGGSVAWPPPSHFYLTANLKDIGFDGLPGLSAGVGLTSPFGLKIRWPDDGPFSTVVTEATLQPIDIKPTIAYKFFDMVSLGVGADIYTFASFIGEGQAELHRNDPNIPGMPPTELNGTDTALGYNISALFTLIRDPVKKGEKKGIGKPRLNIGVVYRSGTDLNLEGKFLVNGTQIAEAEARVPIPQIVNVGIAGWLIRDEKHEWKLEYDMDWIDWSSFETFDVTLHFPNGFNLPDQSPRNWNDSYTLSFGTEYKRLNPNWLPNWEIAGRAGYQRSQAPNPDSTFDPSVPDANWNRFAVGMGLKCKSGGYFLGFISCGSPNGHPLLPTALVMDLGFSAAFWETRTISGNILSPTIDGTYKTQDWYGGLISLGFLFGD